MAKKKKAAKKKKKGHSFARKGWSVHRKKNGGERETGNPGPRME